jgi:hypothetical protein
VGGQVLHVGDGGMVARGLVGGRAGNHPVGGAGPGDEAAVLPVGVVVADQHRDPAKLGVEYRKAEIADRHPALVLGIETVLAVFPDVAGRADQGDGIVAEPGSAIAFGDADDDIHVVGARHLGDRRRRLARDRIEIRLHHGKIVEDVADGGLLRQNGEAHALPRHVLDAGDHSGNVAVEIAPGRIERDSGDLESLCGCGRGGPQGRCAHEGRAHEQSANKGQYAGCFVEQARQLHGGASHSGSGTGRTTCESLVGCGRNIRLSAI